MSATLTKVEVPDIGDFDDVPVIEILVSVGDSVAVEDPLVTLESDKATMDVPAPFAGVVKEISVSVGDRVAQGTVLMSVEAADGEAGPSGDGDGDGGEPAEHAAAADRAAEATTVPAESVEAPSEPPASEPAGSSAAASASEAAPTPAPEGAQTNGGGPIYASPSARRLARELGVDLRAVTGSGRKGRITKEDVQNLADGKGAPARGPGDGAGAGAVSAGAGSTGLDLLPWPTVDFEKFGDVERVARTRIQRISAPNLARNWVMIPHVTHNDEADITELEAWRKRLNEEYSREGVKFISLAIVVGETVSPSHWYWAAIAAFVIFAGTNSWAETLDKGWQRLLGTVLGVPSGVLVATLVSGNNVASLVMIFVCLFCAFYFMKVTYSLMTFWISTMLALMYGLLGEFTYGLLLLRIEETAVGAVIGIAAAVLVLPINTRAKIRGDAHTFFLTLSDLVEASVASLLGTPAPAKLTETARQLDRDLAAVPDYRQADERRGRRTGGAPHHAAQPTTAHRLRPLRANPGPQQRNTHRHVTGAGRRDQVDRQADSPQHRRGDHLAGVQPGPRRSFRPPTTSTTRRLSPGSTTISRWHRITDG